MMRLRSWLFWLDPDPDPAPAAAGPPVASPDPPRPRCRVVRIKDHDGTWHEFHECRGDDLVRAPDAIAACVIVHTEHERDL